ncbi:alpha/beta hydrolase [Micromonospora sp. NPDC048999]|uniref:alpha/beta fold hydrolase n=1 Tax=Micromonospora sp. NPDC048999 TaxID=3155391 RepID=UPI0033C1B005
MTATRTGFAVSSDGTRIRYQQLGTGPGVVLLHGAMQTSANQSQLAQALADAFTVTVPDRRGRGESGPYGDDYRIQREVEDVAAVLTETGAHNIYGVSAGGLIALQAALTLPAITSVAVYEPALLMEGSARQTTWLSRFDREMAEGRVAAALITSMKGLQLAPPILNVIPRRLLESLTAALMNSEEKKAKPGDATMRMLAPTLHYEGLLLAEMMGKLNTFRALRARVLLLGGSKGLPYLKPSLDALERVLPQVERVEFPGLDHGGSSDVTEANKGGKPELVAARLRRFFAAP